MVEHKSHGLQHAEPLLRVALHGTHPTGSPFGEKHVWLIPSRRKSERINNKLKICAISRCEVLRRDKEKENFQRRGEVERFKVEMEILRFALALQQVRGLDMKQDWHWGRK